MANLDIFYSVLKWLFLHNSVLKPDIRQNSVTLSDFQAKIATGNEWMSVYRIEIGQPGERIKRKIKAKWQMTGSEDAPVQRNTVAWRPDNDKCGIVVVQSKPDPTQTNSWGRGGVVLKQVNSTFARQIRFVSRDTSSYFWWVLCFNRDQMVGLHCPDLIVVLMVPTARLRFNGQVDLSGLPWGKIEDDLQSVEPTVDFTKERLRYNWIGTECDFSANKIDGTTCVPED